jgi:hypothetical protein
VPSWGPASAWVAARFFPQCLGEKAFASFAEEVNSEYVGPAVCGVVSCRMSGSLPRWLWCCLWCCLLLLGRSMAARPPHGRRLHHARVGYIHGFSRATGRTGRLYKTSYAVGAVVTFLDSLVLTQIVSTGAKTSSCALVQPLLVGAEVVAASGGADVVASAGEAAHYRGGCLRWRVRQRHLPPDLRLFGFYGLAVTPRRRTGARTYSQ